MGRENSGRRPLPTALKILRGNPGKRRLNAREPQLEAPSPAFDTPPPELIGDEPAEAEWRRLAPILRGARVVTDGDRSALLALCQQWSRYLEATRAAAGGLTTTTEKGLEIASPYVAIADKALTQCRILWTELGLTPSSRSRISALPAPAAAADKWQGLI